MQAATADRPRLDAEFLVSTDSSEVFESRFIGAMSGMLPPSVNSKFDRLAGQGTALMGAADFTVWYEKGEVLANLGRYAEALRHFEEALALDSGNSDARLYSAVCLIHVQRPQEALSQCDRILAAHPNHAQAWMFRGAALQRLGRYKEAYRCYSCATEKA